MQQILFFFIRNKNFLLFTLLFSISIFLTVQSHSYHKNKFVNSSNYVTGSFYDLKSSVTSYFSLKKQNTILIEENNRIRKKLEFYKNKFSHYELDTASINSKYYFYHAKVINNSYSKTKNNLTINKGTNDSLKIDLGVVTSKGIVGIVAFVRRFGIRCRCGCCCSHVISIAFAIVTGGKSTIFPEGILIGTVKNFKMTEDKNSKYLNIQLFNDMTNLEHVYLINNIDANEIINLEKEIKDVE